ncbi:hypothetical protein AWENTII_003318 [Aspergillus wentii]|nr:hypothetical protein MW887_012011 [Aspergillus wentii]
MASTGQPNTLHAVYSPPSGTTHTFQHHISSPPPSDVKAKVAYLSELRELAPKLQDEINVFLTQRMEEDKQAAEAQGRKVSEKEAKEEANYGEEVVEEDDA